MELEESLKILYEEATQEEFTHSREEIEQARTELECLIISFNYSKKQSKEPCKAEETGTINIIALFRDFVKSLMNESVMINTYNEKHDLCFTNITLDVCVPDRAREVGIAERK